MSVIEPVNINHKHSRAINWLKLISITGGAQGLVQILGLVSGIVILRLLPTNEYALYTLANTMLGTMTLLADGGISSGVMSQGGKVWRDPQKLGVVMVTGLQLRKTFAVASLVLVSPVLIYLLRHNGATWLNCTLIVLSLVPAFLAALSDSLYEIAPKLLQDIGSLQKNQIATNISRMIILLPAIFMFPWTFIAILCSGVSRIWGNFRLRKIISPYTDLTQHPDPEVRTAILGMVKRILPGAVYYCFSGQITIWLVSIFGTTTAIAQVGALSRLTIVLSIFTTMFSTLISPRFARLPNDRSILLKRYIQILVGLVALGLVIVGLVWLFPSQVLWILGSKYRNLQKEIVINVIGSCITLLAGSSFVLYSSRGWAINPVISIVIEVLSICVGAIFLNISTIMGVLLFNILVASVQFLIHGSYCVFKIWGAREDAQPV